MSSNSFHEYFGGDSSSAADNTALSGNNSSGSRKTRRARGNPDYDSNNDFLYSSQPNNQRHFSPPPADLRRRGSTGSDEMDGNNRSGIVGSYDNSSTVYPTTPSPSLATQWYHHNSNKNTNDEHHQQQRSHHSIHNTNRYNEATSSATRRIQRRPSLIEDDNDSIDQPPGPKNIIRRSSSYQHHYPMKSISSTSIATGATAPVASSQIYFAQQQQQQQQQQQHSSQPSHKTSPPLIPSATSSSLAHGSSSSISASLFTKTTDASATTSTINTVASSDKNDTIGIIAASTTRTTKQTSATTTKTAQDVPLTSFARHISNDWSLSDDSIHAVQGRGGRKTSGSHTIVNSDMIPRDDGDDQNPKKLPAKPKEEFGSTMPSILSDSTHPDSSAPVQITITSSDDDIELLTPEEIHDIKGFARELKSSCREVNLDMVTINDLLILCQVNQRKVSNALEVLLEGNSKDLMKYFELNDILNDAIVIAEKVILQSNSGRTVKTTAAQTETSRYNDRSQHQEAHQPTTKGQQQHRLHHQPCDRPKTKGRRKFSLEIEALARNKDIFSLICMLRAKGDKQLDAALALMKFARGNDDTLGEDEIKGLRGEIHSSGGLHSLLTLFRTKKVTHEVKVVAALSVAYLSPSVTCNSATPLSTGDVGTKIIECLRYLSTARPVSPRGEPITQETMYQASIQALSDFWVNDLVPTLIDTNRIGTEDISNQHGPHHQTNNKYQSPLLRLQHRRLPIETGNSFFEDQISINPQTYKLLEMTVALIVRLAQPDHSLRDDDSCSNNSLSYQQHDVLPQDSMYTLVESMCIVDAARPIAVREGFLKVIVSWLRSGVREKIRPAALALQALASIQERYLAGWVHSQIINEGPEDIVKLLVDRQHDIRLAASQIISSLCVAPHTRAALVNAQSINYLIPLLYDHNSPASQQVALAAGSALLKLASGSTTQASLYSNLQVLEETDIEDNTNRVMRDIIQGGAIGPFVSMANTDKSGKTRFMSIEALRIFSEETGSNNQTKARLFSDGAAEALGRVLWDDVDKMRTAINIGKGGISFSEYNRDAVVELYNTLCALSNLLGASPADANSSKSTLNEELIYSGCVQVAESGGIGSLLWISGLPFKQKLSLEPSPIVNEIHLVTEACRALACISPLLTSKAVARNGCSTFAYDVLKSLISILNYMYENGEGSDIAQDIQFDSLRGIAALAEYEPLKLMIVGESLPRLLQIKNKRDDRLNVSNIATQVCLALGFAEDEVAAQVAGNDPSLLVDWFCLQRTIVLQAMAREEVRRVLADTWINPIKELQRVGVIPLKLVREVSQISSSTAGTCSDDDENEGHRTPLECLFPNLEDDTNLFYCQKILDEYNDIFGPGSIRRRVVDNCSNTSSTVDGQRNELPNLLINHVYPLNSIVAEREWILAQQKTLHTPTGDYNMLSDTRKNLSPCVQEFLDCCFPSRLIQREVLPINDIQPDASFNFRAIVMPQRRYFSFRREGQLVAGLCEKNNAAIDSDDIYWTVCFTNSSFAGEFGETLVQCLYRCPMIQGLSFIRSLSELNDDEVGGDNGSVLLANLAGSLPPWISSLTFDNTVGNASLQSLISILETMGKLSSDDDTICTSENSSSGHGQGTFRCFSLRNSPGLNPKILSAFFGLLGSPKPSSGHTSGLGLAPLSTLRVLDLSGNGLSDDMCSKVIALAHIKNSGCSLEQLDLSRNHICQGAKVLRVLQSYVKNHRYGVALGKKSWNSQLHTLNMSSNQLSQGTLALEIILLLKNSALGLKSLDLSSNGIEDSGYSGFSDKLLTGSLVKNSTLLELNLSRNQFSSVFINSVIETLSHTETSYGVGFLHFDDNTPQLTRSQRSALDNIQMSARKVAYERYAGRKNSTSNEMDDDKKVTSSHIFNTSFHDSGRDLQTVGGDYDDASVGTEFSMLEKLSKENMITVLFSAPLVYRDEQRNIHPFAKLDFDMERELIWQCLKEASRDIELSFDNATHDRLLAAMTKRCGCLHYSGHGHQMYLPLEDGKGGPNWLEVNVLERLISTGVQDGGAPFKFVFVSACHSGLAGETFASAGVPHVVCCQQESELKDAAALAFTRQFYLALAVGRTVKDSFDQGCKAVRATPNLRNPEEEMKKFVLLPIDGHHDVPVFDAHPIPEWPKTGGRRSKLKSKRGRRSLLNRGRSIYLGSARSSELSVRNMMQEDPSPTPPQSFLGREVDMYTVLTAILSRRLVSVLSEPGVGCSSLVCAVCHYINERRNTLLEFIDRIYFVKAKRRRTNNKQNCLIAPLYEKLVEEGRVPRWEDGIEMEAKIFKALKPRKALVVFDGTDLLRDSEEAQEFTLFLSDLFGETQDVRVLLTGRKSLGIPAFGGVVEQRIVLGPLDFANTVRLFANLCPHLHTPGERAALFAKLVVDGEQASYCRSDHRVNERTAHVFGLLGDGIPSGIEKAAYAISSSDFQSIIEQL